MSFSKVVIVAASILGVSASVALAHPTSGIEDRIAHQAYKIEAGRQSGAITWFEGLRLRAEQRHIKRVFERYLADGKFTGPEYRDVGNMQRDAQDNIDHEMNDGWRRLSGLPRVGR